MSRIIRTCSAVLLAVLLLTLLPMPAAADEPVALPTVSHVASAYLYNIEHNMVLFSQNIEDKVYPTATVKMMVGLLAIERFGDQMEDTVTITPEMVSGVVGNNIGLKTGEIVTYRDLISAVLVGGANDAATALAVCTDGSVAKFLDRMNARADAIGAVNTHYTNPSGIHDEQMYTTCSDTARIAMEAYKNPTFMEICSLEKYSMPETNLVATRTIHNKNALISRAVDAQYYYKYAYGMSSGFTTQGGYALVTTASLDNCSYLCVIMGAESDEETIYSYTEAAKLLRWAFTHYGYREVLPENKIMAEIKVNLSDSVDYVSCHPERALSCYMPLDDNIDYVITQTVKMEDTELNAPISRGQQIGVVTVTYGDTILGNVPLVASADIARSEFLYALSRIKQFVGSRFFIATAIAAVVLFLVYTFGMAVLRYRSKNKRFR